MKHIGDYSARDDLPESLNRANAKELAELWDRAQLKFVDSQISKILIYPVIDQLESDLVDALAIQLHCDFYDKGLSLEARRQIVKTSIAWHRIKGTPAAVEMLTQTIFHESRTKEWFEYGGRPYFFRMVQDISDGTEDVTRETLALLKKAIWMGKNVRSWLELLEFVCNMEDEEGANVGEGDFGARISVSAFHDPVPYGINNPNVPTHGGGGWHSPYICPNGAWRHDGAVWRGESWPGALFRGGIEDMAHDRLEVSAGYRISDDHAVEDRGFGYWMGMDFADRAGTTDGNGELEATIHYRHNGLIFHDGSHFRGETCDLGALDGSKGLKRVCRDGRWRHGDTSIVRGQLYSLA